MPGTSTLFRIAEGIIILEFGLVLLFILLTYILKKYYASQARRIQGIKNEIELYLRNAKPNQPLVFPRRWSKLKYLVTIIEKLDAEPGREEWKAVRKNLLQTIVLPLARKAASQSQRHWMQRLYAAEAFRLHADKDDEKHILSLVNDGIPLVCLNALYAGITFGSSNIIRAIILNVAAQRRITQGTYLQAFSNASPEVLSIVVDCLKHSNDPYIRTICYKILIQSPHSVEKVDPRNDLISSNLELRIVAAKYLTIHYKDEAVPKLAYYSMIPSGR